MAVTEGDTLKPTIDAGCAITAENGITPERSTGRATWTLARHAPPAREPQHARQHPRRRLERKSGVPARHTHAFHRVCAYAPRAPRDAIKCAGLRNDAFNPPYRGAQRPSHIPARGRQRGRLRCPATADTRRSVHACVAATPAARPGSRRPCGSATRTAQPLVQADQHERLVGPSQ